MRNIFSWNLFLFDINLYSKLISKDCNGGNLSCYN